MRRDFRLQGGFYGKNTKKFALLYAAFDSPGDGVRRSTKGAGG